ncbi:MAG: excinuclease ABC subunit UvrC [Syntrophomonadaceae bacterium]|nr:excinuclease ABC subunit UvrC [Syntrophomonadaceae bacterium]
MEQQNGFEEPKIALEKTEAGREGDALVTKLQHLPVEPGVYLFKDVRSRIIYVGKARSLRPRVRSYFQAARNLDPKTQALVQQIVDLDYIITDSEVEALILECNLIKMHRPKYNIMLRDDKHYPYLKVTLEEEFPRVIVVRSIKKDGGRYFGPYTDVGALRETLRLMEKIFPLRSCKKKGFSTSGRPCLNYHIQRCLAPCGGQVSQADYGELVKQVIWFLEGRFAPLAQKLTVQMEKAAQAWNFERAAQLRDQLEALQAVAEKQKIISAGLEDRDVIGVALGFQEAVGQVFFVRAGKLVGRQTFWLRNTQGAEVSQVLGEFLKQYYAGVETVPPVILLPEELPVTEKLLLEEWLAQKRAGRRVKVVVPQRGEKRRLVELAVKNARLHLEEQVRQEEAQQEQRTEALQRLQQQLEVPVLPCRIEGYDISNIQGTDAVGSMVVFQAGEPDRSQYRRFRIQTVSGPNDFASLQEVLRRRFMRGLQERVAVTRGELEEEQTRFAHFPDLLIVDGGKGQLQAARQVMKELGVADIPTFGLAEEFEYLYTEGRSDPLVLPNDSPELHLLQRLRDEAHRFALEYHRLRRGKTFFSSVLEAIPGIGPKRRKALLKHFGSVKRIRQASIDELAGVPGITAKAAQAVWDYFNQMDVEGETDAP